MSLITVRNSVGANQSASWSKGNNQCKSFQWLDTSYFPCSVCILGSEGSYLP